MTKEERIEAIDKSENTGEKKSVHYDKKDIVLDVKKIKLSYLLYNPYNGRIRSRTKSYESQFNILNPENETDKLQIEQFLYDSASGRNEKTKESLFERGQQEIGIITKDGVIIDGNRRAMLLNIINKDNPERDTFKAVILPDELQGHEKEVTLLETSYQMGVDSKVDYNPIEKYIRCKELKTKHNLLVGEIAHIMAEDEKKILDWLDILNIMEEYLIYLGTPEVYTRLSKKEGHFVDFRGYLKTYSGSRHNSVKWNYEESDITKLKQIYFDYIRIGIPVQRARVIAKPALSNSFFCHEELWSDFVAEHETIKASFSEKTFSDVKQKIPDASDEEVIRLLDNQWLDASEEKLYDNLSYNETILNDIQKTYHPIKILRRIVNNIGQIKYEDVDASTRNEVVSLIQVIIEKLTILKGRVSK